MSLHTEEGGAMKLFSSPSCLISLVIASVVIAVVVIRTIHIFLNEGVIEYVRSDWQEVLPYRLATMRFRGVNRPAYALICVVYYSLKSAFLLILAGTIRLYKFVFWDIWKWLFTANKRDWWNSVMGIEDEEDEEDEEVDSAEPADQDESEDELLQFVQLFRIGEEMCLLIHHVEMCPDETAFIRVIDDEGGTPLYKRKVRRDKNGNRYIVFNATNHYLDDKKTQPTSIKQ